MSTLQVRYKVIRKVLVKGIVKPVNRFRGHSTRGVRRWYKNFERPSRERVSGEGSHRGRGHVSVHITGIPQGRDLGVQSSVVVRVVTKGVVRA